MQDSVKLIDTLILKLTGQYSGTLKTWLTITFGFSRIWNYIRKMTGFFRPINEFYPLLTDLVKEIYEIFGYEKNKTDCNEFIKNSIFNYFKIENNGNISFEKFKNDIKNLRNLFIKAEKNFELDKENIENLEKNLLDKKVFEINYDKFTNLGKLFLEQEKKFFTIHIANTIRNLKENQILIDDEEKEPLVDDNDKNTSLDDYEKDFSVILEKIINYIKKEFGRDYEGNIVDNKNDKILLKIFLINLVCKDLTYELCEQSQNVWAFFLNLANQYNKAIEGLKAIKDHFENEEKIILNNNN